VAVAPRRMLSIRRSRGIKQGGLSKQDERVLAAFPVPSRALRYRELIKRAPEVHSGSSQTCSRFPGNRFPKKPIELEYSRPLPEARQPFHCPGRQSLPANRDDLPWRQIVENSAAAAQLLYRSDWSRGPDLSAEVRQQFNQKICYSSHRWQPANQQSDRIRGASSRSRPRTETRAARLSARQLPPRAHELALP
jgi:hypothetical protein